MQYVLFIVPLFVTFLSFFESIAHFIGIFAFQFCSVLIVLFYFGLYWICFCQMCSKSLHLVALLF
jgi:hypothetical protein